VTATDYVIIGRVAGAHGIQGGLKIRSFADSEETFAALRTMTLRFGDGCQACHKVLWLKPHGKALFLLSLEGVTDRGRAEDLLGAEVLIPRAQLPPLEDGTYYWCDLIGCAVYDGELYIGRLESIISTGSNDVYVVSDGENETLVPALASVVREVDINRKRLVVTLPEGL
jgi:16S rRNA processing protein RimM